MQSKNIFLTMDSIQHDISPDITHAVYEGRYTFLSGSHIVSYEECFEEDNHAPLKSNCLLRLSDEKISITKHGDIATKMVFEKGNTFHDSYRTPFGSFPMEIKTDALSITKTNDVIRAKIDYLLSLNHAPVSHCTITILVTGQKKA